MPMPEVLTPSLIEIVEKYAKTSSGVVIASCLLMAMVGLLASGIRVLRARRRQRLCGKTVAEAFVPGQPPNVFSHGFVLPAIDDPRWKKDEGVDVFRLGSFRVERRFLTRDRKVMPIGRFSDKCNWVVFMGDEPLPLRTGELNRYGDELAQHYRISDREALAAEVLSEVLKDD